MNDSESKLKHGLVWLGAAGAALRAIDIFGSIAFLWLLTSEQMGLASLSWSVAVIIESVNGLGVGTALVQAESLEESEVDSLFWFATGFGALFVSGMMIAAPWIARSFGTAELAPMVSVAALRLVFMAIALVPMQLLTRQLKFQQIAAIQTLAAGGAAITKVGLAALGFGAWALVIGHTSEGLFTVMALYAIAPYWPKLVFSLKRTQRFVRFGMKAAISTILYHSYRNLDFVIVGRAFGVATLGAFRVAFDVAMIPQMAILDVVNRTVFPIYSRIGVGDRPRLKALFLRMTRDTSLVSGTLAVMLYFFGSDILWLVSGGKWASAGPMIRVLCWAAFLRTLTQAIPQVFHAAGRPELAAYDSLLTLVCFLGMGIGWVVLLGPSWGANAVSLAWVTTYVLTLTVLRAMARRVIGVSVLEYAKNLAHPLGLMAILFIALLGVRAAGAMMGNPLLATAFGVFSGCAIVMAYLRVALGVTLGDLLGKNVKAPES